MTPRRMPELGDLVDPSGSMLSDMPSHGVLLAFLTQNPRSRPGTKRVGDEIRRARAGTARGLATAARSAALAACLAVGTGLARAADSPAPSAEELLSAVVAVHARVPGNARTAEALGTQRTGSGVVIDANGLVVTIGYLIMEAEEVKIVPPSGRDVPARVLAYDHDSGFGLLRAAEPLGVTPMRLGDSSALAEGAQVLISSFGGPAATRPAVLVSRREFAGYWEYLLEDALFTSPPHPRFGGAAMVGRDGELLGIGSLVVSDALVGERTLWLGIYTDDVQGRLLVRRVATEGPAARAGVETGDVIVGVAGEAVTSMADFYRKVWSQGTAGDPVPLTLLKGRDVEQITVTSGDRYDWLRLAEN